jgi:putative addiction module killer protein
MVGLRRTDQFDLLLRGLKDIRARALIGARLDRLRLENPGDVRPVGGGVSELRINYGPGYRVYLVRSDRTVLTLLGGGEKSTQKRDIERAKELAKQLRTNP